MKHKNFTINTISITWSYPGECKTKKMVVSFQNKNSSQKVVLVTDFSNGTAVLSKSPQSNYYSHQTGWTCIVEKLINKFEN